ncbi:MAG TPA: hypothetical protein VI160_11510 [Gemmatimonadales bacterium]
MPQPTVPLPVEGLAGRDIGVMPLTLIAADDSLHWTALVSDRVAQLALADSVIGAMLAARAPEVHWVSSATLRREARRAPGIVSDPEQMGSALLRAPNIVSVPDPLRSQLRALGAIAGGRFLLVPAALVYQKGVTAPAAAELSIVLVDIRLGEVQWRSLAKGEGADPWSALSAAMKQLTPGLP